MVELIKGALIPGTIAFLLVGLIVGVLLLHGRAPLLRLARRWLTLLAALYVILSIPVVSNALIHGLQGNYASVATAEDAHGARVVVVVGAGVVSYSAGSRAIHEMGRRTAYTALEAARVFDIVDPAWVVVSGGIPDPISQSVPESQVIRDRLVSLGVPSDRILVDSESRNTAAQLSNVSRLLRDRGLPTRVVVVITPAHSRRVMLLAAREKLDAIPSVAAELRYDRGQEGWRAWRPSLDALHGSASAVYEYMALGQAWLSGD